MRKKLELIQQIKAAESISIDKTKLVDLTSNAGHGLLNEMSLVELSERLAQVKQFQENEKNQTHDRIIKSKVEKDQSLVESLKFINSFRTEKSNSEKLIKK